jgi:hypothetical protein
MKKELPKYLFSAKARVMAFSLCLKDKEIDTWTSTARLKFSVESRHYFGFWGKKYNVLLQKGNETIKHKDH